MDKLEQKEYFWERLRKTGLICLCLLFFDIASTGAGHYVTAGWFSPRIVLTLLVLGCGLPLYCRDLKNQVRKPLFLLLLALFVYLAMEAFRGRVNGNHAGVWASDIMGFAWLGLIPLIQVLVRDKDDLWRVISFGLAGATFQAVLCVLFNIIFAGVAPDALPGFVEWIWDIQWGTLLPVEYNAVRIFCRSSMYMVIACVLFLGRQMKSERFSIKYAVLFLLNFIALFFTYTRSMYLTLFAGLVLALVVLCRQYPVRRVLLRTLVLAGIFLLSMTAEDLILRQGSFQYAMARCFHVDLNAVIPYPHTWTDTGPIDMEDITENTNATREQTVRELKEMIRTSPLIGHGLGAVVPSRDGQDEYFYHDVLMRCGVIGLLLYLAPAGLALIQLIKARRKLKEGEEALIFTGLICFLIATYYNPWMNAAVGISWYAVTLRSAELKGEEIHE
ncbi:MAG: O-antigen ligase family protein [Lachnospiraceae bacterium]|nr:O-antigen ligase family protein [Lachnospiraceae bacterium]